jgi:hypothetical protein
VHFFGGGRLCSHKESAFYMFVNDFKNAKILNKNYN